MHTWRTATVAELQREGVLLVEDGNHGEYRPRSDEFVERGIAFIRAADMDAGQIRFDDCSHINARARQRITKGVGAPGDVLLSHKGTVGKIALASEDAPPFVCSPQTTFWRSLDPQVLDRRYLHVFLRSPMFHSQLASRAGETDMAPYVSLTAQRAFSVTLPPIDIQQSIASIVGTVDDKMELNRRMNDTLGAIAQSIFNDWLVDFGPTRAKADGRMAYLAPEVWALFPDKLDETGKPEGWTETPLDQIADFLNGIALQKYPAGDGAFLPVIKIAQLRAGSCDSGDRASTEIPPAYLVEDGDVLFSWSGSLLHRVWTAGRGALNQHLFKVTSKRFEKWFYFYWIGHHMADFQSIAASKATTMGHIQRHHLKEAMTIVPDKHVLRAANLIIGPLFERMIANDLENRTLAATRDLLLPRLISGEIRVNDAEHELAAVA